MNTIKFNNTETDIGSVTLGRVVKLVNVVGSNHPHPYGHIVGFRSNCTGDILIEVQFVETDENNHNIQVVRPIHPIRVDLL